MNLLKIARLHETPIADALGDGEQLVGVTAAQHRIKERTVGNQIETVAGVGVAAIQRKIQCDRTLGALPQLGTHGLNHQTMCEVQVMHRRECARAETQTRRMPLCTIAQI